MRQGLYTSGFFHIFGGFLLIVNFQVLEENQNEVLNKVSVKLLSERELIELAEGEKTSALEVENFQPETIVDLNSSPQKISIPRKANIGNEINNEIDGITIHRILFDRAFTLSISFVSM